MSATSDATLARHWIDGAWQASGTPQASVSPSTGEILGYFVAGGATAAQAGIVAAQRALRTSSWSRDRQLRHRALNELATAIEARCDQLALTLSRENGKLLWEAHSEASSVPATLRYNAGLALSDAGAASEVRPGVLYYSLREPAGVVGIIVPWNAPLALVARSLAPALAAGCTVVVKMPSQTGLTNGLFGEAVAATTSMPPGVVSLFTESGHEGASLLIESPVVNAISYTGSTRVGRIIAAAGARTLKRMVLELGGKTPLIVFEDAPLDQVAPLVIKALTTFNGQFCMTGSRVLVQRSVADRMRALLRTLVAQVRIGPSDDPSSQMGPLIDKASAERVDRLVEEATRYAHVLVRGGLVTSGPLAVGSFFRPSLVEVENLETPLIQQEVFGPVLCFETFDDEADAVRRANATEYGLAAAIFTNDLARSTRVGRELTAGTVWTNTWADVTDRFEEGGFKQSGIGRLRGTRGLEEFQEFKTYVHSAR